VRSILEADPIGNAVLWDRVFQRLEHEVYADGEPPKAVLTIGRSRGPEEPRFIGLHATTPGAAAPLVHRIPEGPIFYHLTEDWLLPLLEPRATDFRPRPAWLFALDPADFADRPDGRVRRLEPRWASTVARLWDPEWPAESYVRSRIEGGPSAAIYEDGRPIAWALTHIVTDRAGLIGMVHVLEGHRRQGLASAVVCALSRELLADTRTPALHAYADNGAALRLFPTLGFRKIKRQVWGDAVLASSERVPKNSGGGGGAP
jgi:GNAT superfamily N-acetyltransferase